MKKRTKTHNKDPNWISGFGIVRWQKHILVLKTLDLVQEARQDICIF
jgi:hypothetical protein